MPGNAPNDQTVRWVVWLGIGRRASGTGWTGEGGLGRDMHGKFADS